MTGTGGDDAAATGLRTTPLAAVHRALGARMVEFGGWEMPLAYPEGTIAEHRSCRSDAAVFDVSHLGTVRVAGPGAYDRLQSTLTNDLGRIAPGRAQYTHLLDDVDGSVVDDMIVWWIDDDTFDVMPNASNTARVRAAIGGEDTTPTRAVLAVQGPSARERLGRVAPDAAAVGRFAVTGFTWGGAACTVAGTGYTGEDGVECAVPVEVAQGFFEAVVASGIPPAGLGARDTLRLEAALPLHGHELGPGITPLQARLGWVVGWETEFRGRQALQAERAAGPARTLVGLATDGRQPPRESAAVEIDGDVAGTVTSGNFSPMLGHGIALALVATAAPHGPATPAVLVQRGRALAATVTSTPFVRSGMFAGAGAA